MLCMKCCLFLLCIPIIQPVSVRIDGSIDVGQNWNFDFTPFVEIGRMSNRSSTLDDSVKISNSTEKPTPSANTPEHHRPARRNQPLAPLIVPIKNFQMTLDDQTTRRVPKKKLKRRKPNKGAGAEIKEFIVDSIQNLHTIVPGASYPVESKRTYENYPIDVLVELTKYPLETKRSTYKNLVMDILKDITKHRVHKKKNRVVKAGFGYDATSSVRVTRPMDLETLHYKKVTKRNKKTKNKHKKHSNNSIERNIQPSASLTIIDGNKIVDILERVGLIKTTKEKNIMRVHTSTSLPKRLTMIYYKQAPYTGEHSYNERHKREHDISQRIHLVKNDERLQTFTLDVFRQSIGVFDAIKSKTNNTKIQNKIDFIARSYRDKFANFVEENQNQKIITRLGTQKVVLNTIETSSRVMTRLMNFLIGDMEKKGILRDGEGLASIWRNQVENEEQQEYVQACQKFNICRSKYSFSSFMADFFTVFLQIDDKKLKQAIDALTEVLKNTDLSKVMDKKMQTRFHANIEVIERAEPNVIRPILWMFRNMLVNKNQPLVVQESVSKNVINQSVALLDVIDLLDERIPASEENMLQWNDLRNSLVQWANGQRDDILEIMQAFVNMVVKNGINKMETKMAHTFHDKFKIFLRSTSFSYDLEK